MYSSRSARKVKGLSADGSTRAWRRMRERVPGKPKSCPDGRPPYVHHAGTARKDGGKDVLSNLQWRCGKDPDVGRPKGS